MTAALACPWCGAILAAARSEACPHCGAVLVERDAPAEHASEARPDAVAPVDDGAADVVQPMTVRAIPDEAVDADPRIVEALRSSPFRSEEADEGVAFPSDEIRREMERMRLHAERASLEAERAALDAQLAAAAADPPEVRPSEAPSPAPDPSARD